MADDDLTLEQRQSLMRYAAASLPVQPARPGRLRRRTPTKARNEDIALAYADLSQHWTVRELADLHGITPARVSQIIAEYCPRARRARYGRGDASRTGSAPAVRRDDRPDSREDTAQRPRAPFASSATPRGQGHGS